MAGPRATPRNAAAAIATLDELLGPPPADVAPLDQFREALLLREETRGYPTSQFHLESTNANLLRYYRLDNSGGFHEKRIRTMVERSGWVEADVTVVELGLGAVPAGIGLVVRERRSEAAPICHGVHALIVRAGLQMAKQAPNLYLPARGLREPNLPFDLFDHEPSIAALDRPGRGEEGLAAMLCGPLLLYDEPTRLNERSAHLYYGDTHHLAPGDVICIRSRANAPPHCHTAVLTSRVHHIPAYALPPNTQLTIEEMRAPPWVATFRRWHRYESKKSSTSIDATRRPHTIR